MAKEKRNATTAWLERSNPLRGLTIAQANTIFDCARNGDTQRLHWMYQEIEAQNPVLSMATTRRAGAAANFKWRITERASMDGSLSSEQKDAAERFFAEIDNFSDVFEHLDLALFRGFAHAQPIWDGNRVQHVELIDSWKFLKKDGEWLFNPACDGFSSNCVSCKDARLITIERRRPVDVPALAIHLREAVGSRDWGRFIERYALPKPAVVMAPNATKKDREDYEDSAVALENGQVTVWPSGASLMDFAGSSRGVDPFTNFITHQEKTILMLATGGTLGSMAESGAGTLAGNAQQDVWDQIVSRDAGILAAAVQRSMLRPFIAAQFLGRPLAVDFDFDLTLKPTPKEIFETAAAAKSAGYIVVQDVLEEETGWKLEKDTAPAGDFGVQKPSGFAFNAKTPLQTRENRLQNAPRNPDGQGDPRTKPPAQIAANRPSGADGVLEAFAKDLTPAAKAVEKFLQDPSKEAAEKLIADLPSLMPSDPEMAAIIADEMAKAAKDAVDGEARNTIDANGMEHGNHDGKFVSKGNGGSPKEPESKPQHDRYGLNDESRLAAEPEKNAERARAALDEVVRKRGGFVDKAAYRPECGWIRLDWGDAGNPHDNYKGGHGLAHIAAKHPEAVKELPGILANGTVYKHEQPGKLYVLHGEKYAVLASLHGGAKKTITEFISSHDKSKLDFIKKQPRANIPGENKGR